MISHPVSHLLPELLLASWAVGLLILDMSGTSPKLRHSLTMAALAISSLAAVFSFSLPSLSLFNGLLYTSNWSSFLKLVLLILAMLAWQLRPNASTNQQPAFFLIVLLLGAFILISATNLWLLLICYFWCLISLFFINSHFFENVAEEAERQWLQIGLISALIMAFGVVSYLLVVKETNWFLTPVESIPCLTIPTVLIFSGLRYLVLNNYPPPNGRSLILFYYCESHIHAVPRNHSINSPPTTGVKLYWTGDGFSHYRYIWTRIRSLHYF